MHKFSFINDDSTNNGKTLSNRVIPPLNKVLSRDKQFIHTNSAPNGIQYLYELVFLFACWMKLVLQQKLGEQALMFNRVVVVVCLWLVLKLCECLVVLNTLVVVVNFPVQPLCSGI